jgi:hypothetical protein
MVFHELFEALPQSGARAAGPRIEPRGPGREAPRAPGIDNS